MLRTAEAFRKLCERPPLNRLFLLPSLFLVFVLYGLLVLAADEFYQGHFSAVAFAWPQFEDSRVSARTISEAIGQFSGQFLQSRDSGGGLGGRFTRFTMFFAFRPSVAREEEGSRLTSGVQRCFVLTSLTSGSRPASQSNSFFGKWA